MNALKICGSGFEELIRVDANEIGRFIRKL